MVLCHSHGFTLVKDFTCLHHFPFSCGLFFSNFCQLFYSNFDLSSVNRNCTDLIRREGSHIALSRPGPQRDWLQASHDRSGSRGTRSPEWSARPASLNVCVYVGWPAERRGGPTVEQGVACATY